MNHAQLIDDYLAGPQKLRAAVAGLTAEQLDARPIPGKWSTKQVVCHLADFEPVYVDRMKRVIAENEPTMFSGDPDLFAARLAYDQEGEEQTKRNGQRSVHGSSQVGPHAWGSAATFPSSARFRLPVR